MTALPRSLNSFSPTSELVPDGVFTFAFGTVRHLEDDGHVVVACSRTEVRAAVASHVPGLIASQAVLLALSIGEPMPLVIAAWPTAGAPMTPPWHFDRSTGTLALEANNLELGAINRVSLDCGGARLQFTRDGAVETRGQSITSAAIETHRIEGGSIELN